MTPFPSIRRDATLLVGAMGSVYVWLLVALSPLPVTAQFEGCPPELTTANAVTNILNSSVDIPQTCIPAVAGAASQQARCYYTYVPPCAAAQADQAVPLVVDLHGIGSCPAASAFYTGWAQKAATECFVVAWPMGTVDTDVATISCFSVPGGVPTTTAAEADKNNVASDCCCFQGFLPLAPAVTQDPLVLRNMIIDLVQRAPTAHNVTIDQTRIYMAGHSNGCIASLAMAALQSDLVAAVCCHAGSVATPVNHADLYSPVPIWRVHGEKDDTIPYDGGVVLGQQFVSAQRGLEYFGNANGCNVEIVTTPLPGGVGTRMQRVNCTNNATVELVSLTESGHSPYANATEFDAGASDTTIDTTSMAWDFCSVFRKSEVPPVFFTESVTPTAAPSTQQQPTMVPATLPSGGASMPRLSSILRAVVGACMVVHLLG